MQNLSVVFTSPGVAELLPCDIEKPGPGQVLVEKRLSTISAGTERANLVGDPNISTNSDDPVAHFPRRVGYASSGVVIEVGEGVTAVKPGDRVAVTGGTHKHYEVLGVSGPSQWSCNVHRIPCDDITFSDAAVMMIATFPLAAVRKTRLELGEPALVMGQGVLGQISVLLLRAAGAAPVVAADPDEGKRARALELGADFAVDPFSPDFAEKVKGLTAGGPKAAIEVTGSGSGLDGALDCIRSFGRIALLGCTRHADFSIDYYRKVHGPGITLIGAHTNARPQGESSPGWWTLRDDMQALLTMSALGRLKLSRLVQEIHPASEAPQVFGRLANEKVFPVVQLDWTRL